MEKEKKRELAPLSQRILLILGLLFLSPLIAEFFLGNISISAIGTVLFLAPMYGGGALLIREIARRKDLGWPAIALLGLAYAIFEEGLVTQSLFNPNYAGYQLLEPVYIPFLGIGVWWTLYVLALHTIWSIGVSIVLLEALVPKHRSSPWLGKVGFTVVAILFVLGSFAAFWSNYGEYQFIATPAQLMGSIIAMVILIIIALNLKSRVKMREKKAPNPWLVGTISLVISSLFMMNVNQFDNIWGVCITLVLFAMMIYLCREWSSRNDWGAIHLVALAGGALLTYTWNSFPQQPIIGATGTIDLIGNIGFAVLAIMLLFFAVNRNKT